MISYKCDACGAGIEDGQRWLMMLVEPAVVAAGRRPDDDEWLDLCSRCASAIEDVTVEPQKVVSRWKPKT